MTLPNIIKISSYGQSFYVISIPVVVNLISYNFVKQCKIVLIIQKEFSNFDSHTITEKFKLVRNFYLMSLFKTYTESIELVIQIF